MGKKKSKQTEDYWSPPHSSPHFSPPIVGTTSLNKTLKSLAHLLLSTLSLLPLPILMQTMAVMRMAVIKIKKAD